MQTAVQPPTTTERTGLARRIGLFDATMIVMGGIIGSGIFMNPHVVAQIVRTPAAILGAWVTGGLIALAGAFIYAELAARRPQVGGQYAYIREAFHPGLAFIYGWTLLLVTQTGGMAAVAVTFGRYFIELTGVGLTDWVLAGIALMVLTIINCLGVRAGSTVQSALMVLKIAAVLALVAFGLIAEPAPRPLTVDSQGVQPGGLALFSTFGAALVPVLFAYGGWQTANFIAGEVREPRRNLPRALVLGVVGVVILYLSVNYVCVYALGVDGLATTVTPASEVMRIALGEKGARLIAVGIAISTLGFLSQSILTAPRVYFAMADDRLFFKSVAWLHPRTRVPVIAIALQGVLAIIIAGSGQYGQILNYVMSVDSIFFGFSAAALLVLRRRERRHLALTASFSSREPEPNVPSESRSRIKVPLVIVAAFVLVEWLVAVNTIYSYPKNSAIGLGILVAGIPVYLYWRSRSRRSGRTKSSPYIEWAKTRSRSSYNLAISGAPHYPLSELGASIEQIELSGPSWYGYQPLQEALAQKCGVKPENIVAATGTSMANHLAMAALVEPGDQVVVEMPAYDPLLLTARYLGARVKRLARRAEDGFRLDLAQLEASVSRSTRLIVMSNLHNPSGALTDSETIRAVGEIAERVGARVLVDEVYLEAMFEKSPQSAFHSNESFVTTSSLTKAYGLSGLRCGWILADDRLAKAIWRLNDLFGNVPAHPAERLSVIALERLDRIAARAKELLDGNRALLNEFLASRDDLDCPPVEYGTIAFPRLVNGRVDEFCGLLREKYDTTVVPGRFFEMPGHFRIGIGCDRQTLAGGLERLGSALSELK